MAWADQDGDGALSEQEFIDAIMADATVNVEELRRSTGALGSDKDKNDECDQEMRPSISASLELSASTGMDSPLGPYNPRDSEVVMH